MKFRSLVAVFLPALALFGAIHATPGFGDPDAYYHLATAKLTAASGPIRTFEWLPFTTLAEHYGDQHFLYHLALIPFLGAFGDFLGLKIATIAFAALAMAAFAWMLAAHGLRRSWLWTLPLLFAPGFLFRLLLTKATALALAALFLFLGYLKTKNRLAVFCLAAAYVWLHAGWPILGIAASAHAIVRRDPKTFLATVAGLAAGLVFNPFFPSNFFFNWEQIVQIAVVGARDSGVQVGNEWLAADLGWLLVENAIIFLVMGAAFAYLGLLISGRDRPPEASPARWRDIVFAASLAAVFLCLTLRQARQKEYFLPLALFTGALLGDTLRLDSRATLQRLQAWLGRWFKLFLALSMVACVLLAVHGVWQVRQFYGQRAPFTRFSGAAHWIREHVPEGEIVFHASWDEFPFLFYRDPTHRYIAGMDPMFFYREDPELYWLWRDIGDGRRRNPSALIREHFRAGYVFVNPKRDKFLPLIKNDPSFERVYQDDEAEVWRIN